MGETSTHNPDSLSALDAQQALLEHCLDLVRGVYDEALGEDVPQPVVILLDCEDEIGGQIARSWLGKAAVDEAISDQRADDPSGDTTTVYAHAFPLVECAQQVPAVFPYLAPVFEAPLPEDGFLAISVTSGGASALSVPLADEDAGASNA